jgi:hypothetical protein
LVHDEGLVRTGGRAVKYGGKRSVGIGQRLLGLPGPRHVIAAIRRLRRSLQIHGVTGTVDLARPVVRHTVLHSFSLIRLRAHIVVRRLIQLVRRQSS